MFKFEKCCCFLPADSGLSACVASTLLGVSSIIFSATACLSDVAFRWYCNADVVCVQLVYFLDISCVFLQITVQSRFLFLWLLLKPQAQMDWTGDLCSEWKKIGMWCPFVWQTILFWLLFLCSHGCASIWAVAWTLHGHYEEKYNPLWRAAGDNIWL